MTGESRSSMFLSVANSCRSVSKNFMLRRTNSNSRLECCRHLWNITWLTSHMKCKLWPLRHIRHIIACPFYLTSTSLTQKNLTLIKVKVDQSSPIIQFLPSNSTVKSVEIIFTSKKGKLAFSAPPPLHYLASPYPRRHPNPRRHIYWHPIHGRAYSECY